MSGVATEPLFEWGQRTCLDFDGATFEPALDAIRLNAQLNRVYGVMRDGQWHTLGAVCDTTGDPQQSVSARLRDLRKTKFGGFVVERQRINGGLFQYRLLRPITQPSI